MYCSISQQLLGIVLDRQDRQPVEDLRKRPLHHLAVFQHVRDARRAAQVVFEHVELAVAVAHQVGARDVAPDAARRLQPRARLAESTCPSEISSSGTTPSRTILLLVVDVVDEQVQRRDALLQPALDAVPFVELDDPRDDVERPDLLGARPRGRRR